MTGTYVLAKPKSRRVLKIGDDVGLIAFSNFLLNTPPTACLPKFYGMAYGPNNTWVGLWCERLDTLSAQQVHDWKQWINDWAVAKGCPSRDPFNAASTLGRLRTQATNFKIGLDVLKADNVMCRPATGDMVFSDPLA